LWELLLKDIPFLSPTAQETLEKSPFSTFSQLAGYIESTTASNKVVKLLARGVVNQLGQSMEVLMRHNMSPFAHFTSTMSAAGFTEAELIMARSMNLREEPIVSSLLANKIMKLENRMKGWYEVMQEAPPPQRKPIYDLFLDDLRASYMELKLNVVKGTNTGSERLDEILLRVKLMLGEILLQEYSMLAKQYTIWEEPDAFVGGSYDESGVLIRKRFGSIARLESRQRGAKVTVEGEMHHAVEMFKDRSVSEYHNGEVRILNMRCLGIIDYKGSRLLFLHSKSDRTSWYMSLPSVKASQESLHVPNSIESPLLEAWLSREKPNQVAKSEFLACYKMDGTRGEIARSIARNCKKVTRMAPMARIAERLGTEQITEPTEDSLILEILNTADLLPELSDNPVPEDWGDFYHEADIRELGERFQSLEAFSLEVQYTTWELNACLRALSLIIAELRDLPREDLQGSTIGNFLNWYERL
jgi:hypothetical protein